jgi:Flp pilus assembly protein CpaB
VCAALAFGGVMLVLRQSGSSGPTRNVLVAKADIGAGAAITADSVRVAPLPAESTPADVLVDPAAVSGKIAATGISANTPLVPALFLGGGLTPSGAATPATATKAATGDHLAIDKGNVALAIPAGVVNSDFASGDLLSVGYYIQPGDHIDILIDPGQPNGAPAGVRYSFQDVLVLRSGTGGSAANAVPTVYVIELPRAQAEALTAVIAHRGPQSVVKYVLRPQDEYGKPGAPNYEDSGVLTIPIKQDQTVNGDALNRLLPR